MSLSLTGRPSVRRRRESFDEAELVSLWGSPPASACRDSPLDPYNWPSWKKHVVLVQVAFYAMMGPFSAASTIPAFENFTEDFDISITQASYTVSIVILFLCSFLLIGPVSARIGRRPVLLVSLIISAGVHLAGAYVDSYGAMMTVRVFQGYET